MSQVGGRNALHLGEHEIFAPASIGIATSEVLYDRPQDVLRDADLARYRAKEKANSRIVLFEQSMHKEAVAILQVENDLRWALDREDVELLYQPIVFLKDGSLSGFEALIRWRRPEHGLLAPGKSPSRDGPAGPSGCNRAPWGPPAHRIG